MKNFNLFFKIILPLSLIFWNQPLFANEPLDKESVEKESEEGIAIKKTALQIHGHRGARAVLPENSLVAFEYALNLGVDVLEMDLVVTQDDVLVVNHDLFLNPDLCVDEKGDPLKKTVNIREITFSQLQTYDCGSLKNARFPKQKTISKTSIPKFEDVLLLLKNSKNPHAKKIRLNIETKIEKKYPQLSPEPKKFVALILKLLKKYSLLDRSILQSFDFRTIDAMYELDHQIKRALLLESNQQDMVALAEKHKAHIVSPQDKLLNKTLVQKLKKKGVEVVPWTVNDEKGWKKMIQFGVDGIITDDPEALMLYLKK